MQKESIISSDSKKYDLEDRLVDYAIKMSELVEKFYNTKLGNHIGGQLTRCSTAPALNYGEAQSAESRTDLYIK